MGGGEGGGEGVSSETKIVLSKNVFVILPQKQKSLARYPRHAKPDVNHRSALT